jgi:hypothetical protein
MLWVMTGSRAASAAALALVLATAACARLRSGRDPGGVPQDEESEADVPQIGLQRGGRWSVLNIRPPHLSGPHFHLLLKNNVLSGSISGGTAPGGSVHVNITSDGAEGYGPLGPVSLDFYDEDQGTVAEGLWNGGRVHLVFTRESVKGTVTTNSFFYTKSNPGSASGMQAFRGRPSRTADMVDPLPQDMSCEYFLTDLAPDGALIGGSICAGMPQQTRLEVPRVAHAWLTRSELVTVLVAVLSSPPAVMAEEFGPKFEPPPTSAPRR